ncbi:MAG: hypothetical protein QG657_5283 [Acidobacteriota bacterium]|nr:hypothetical protein [Acidobacteriota bacterium]
MNVTAPPLDGRYYGDIVNQALALAKQYCPEWKPTLDKDKTGNDDPGMALVHLFGRLMEIIITRLNQVPDKYFLAFLDFIGAKLRPPVPAKALLRFFLSGSAKVNGRVPARTQVSTEESENLAARVFETGKELVVTPVNLINAFTLDPGNDRFNDATSVVTGLEDGQFEIFKGDTLIDHILYLGDDLLFGLNETSAKGNVTLRLAFQEESSGFQNIPLDWEYSAGDGRWQSLPIDQQNFSGNHPEVTFHIPRDIKKDNVSDHLHYWIRIKLADAISSIPTPHLPIIETITGSIDCSADGVLPDACFTNQLPIDPPENFYPFGPIPTSQNIFHIASDEVFSKTGGDIAISVQFDELGVQGSNENITLTWEYWQGKEWQSIGDINDFTNHFTEEPQSTETETEIPVAAIRGIGKEFEARLNQKGIDTVNKLLKLSKSELVDIIKEGGTQPLDYYVSTAANIMEAANFGLYDKDWLDSSPGLRRAGMRRGGIEFICPQIKSKEINMQIHYWIRVRISSGHYGLPAYYDIEEQKWKAQELNPPKIRTIKLAYRYSSGCNPILKIILKNNFKYSVVKQETGAFLPFVPMAGENPAFYLGFDAPFSNDDVSLFFQAVRQGEGARQLQWEYTGPNGWKRLQVKDETWNLSRQGHVQFIGPKDFTGSEHFGLLRPWLRVRLTSAADMVLPVLKGVYLNTVWAENVVTIENELLGSSDGRANQTLQLSRYPVLPGQQIWVTEREMPAKEEYEKIIEEEDEDAVVVTRDENGIITEIRVRWHEVGNFYASGPRGRHYVVEHCPGKILFGDGVRGLIPPLGRDNIRCSIYRIGGGVTGNLDPGKVAQLKVSLAHIDSVTNVLPAGGGVDTETLEEIKTRGPFMLKHRERAVTVEDFEWLVKEAPGNIARSKCIPVKDWAPDRTVTVIIVPDLEVPKPYPSPDLIRQVEYFLYERTLGTICSPPVSRVNVTGPGYIEISTEADIVPQNVEQSGAVQERVIANLENFLHPLKGGPDKKGWPFGRAVHISEIITLIQDTEGVDYVKSLRLRSGDFKPDNREPVITGVDDKNPIPIFLEPHYLVYSGTHSISIVIDT